MDIQWVQKSVDRINETLISHFSYNITKQRLLSIILFKKGGECTAVIGPSRVGKTNVVSELDKSINTNLIYDPMVRQPVVKLTCRNRGDRGVFSTKSFYLDALAVLEHPFFVLQGTDPREDVEAIRRHDRETVAALEAVLERTLKLLNTKYLIIDETQHLQYMNGGDKSALQMLEFFKTLAEKLDVILIFVGAYPMLNVLGLSPHLLGRTAPIHMKRYDLKHQADQQRFRELLDWFSQDMRFESDSISLLDWEKQLYEGTFGIVGLLSAWVRDGLAEMVSRGEDVLRLEHLLATKKPQPFLNEMWKEIDAGERYLGASSNFEWREDELSLSSSKCAKQNGKSRPFQAKLKRRIPGERK